MSRIGKQPVAIPAGVQIESSGDQLKVKGPKGELSMTVRPEISVDVGEKEVSFTAGGGGRQTRAYHGTMRALVQNMVTGVTQGYERALDIHGVGWNCEIKGREVVLNVGYCHTVDIAIPDGIDVTCPNPTRIVVTGTDKQGVGQLAAKIRASRPPEPYKGKGVRYSDEHVKQKAGKSFGS